MEQMGGKGGTLAALFRQGLPVPDGFVISPGAFSGEALTTASWIDVKVRYYDLLQRSGRELVAVRSSALQEDSANASFAGEFESVLNVADENELAEAIDRVYRSRRSERAKVYSQQTTSVQSHEMAVVVQVMIESDLSGILFSIDPVSGQTATMVGYSVIGSGEPLVAGHETGEQFSLDRDGGALTGPESLEPFGKSLFQLAMKLETISGSPQDIEWTIKDGELYLLQSRPITALSPTPEIWNDSLIGEFLWSNTNIGEAITGVMTPFTWSVFKDLFDHAMGTIGGQSVIGNIAGRPYSNITLMFSVYSALRLSPDKFRKTVEQFIGKLPDQSSISQHKLKSSAIFRFALHNLTGLLRVQAGKRRLLTWLRLECAGWCDDSAHKLEQCGTARDLVTIYRTVDAVNKRILCLLMNVTNRFNLSQSRLVEQLSDKVNAADLSTLRSGLGGNGQLQSLETMLAIAALARGEISRQEFVRACGHRGPDEAEFASPRSAELENWIDRALAEWNDIDVEQLLDQQLQARDAAWSRLRRAFPRQYARLQRLFERAGRWAREREMIRNEMVRVAWVLRNWVLRAAALTGAGNELFYLTNEEVPTLLQGDRSVLELIGTRRETYIGYSKLPRLPNLITGRFDPFQWAADPDRRTDHHDGSVRESVPDEKLITGFAGAVGVVEGPVRVLSDFQQMDEFLPGEILVTVVTNVGWTPLFPRARAIVTDVGAPLSHAAIVARELGIPAVVGTGDATMRLRSGDRVRVDGSNGTVLIL